jgi:hypothetical protein
MILDVALGIVLGVVLLVAGFFSLVWIARWWREHWKGALLLGIPIVLFVYAGATDNAAGVGWSGLLLIGAVLLEFWRSHSRKNS